MTIKIECSTDCRTSDILFDRMRGIRPAVLPSSSQPSPASAREVNAITGPRTSAPPQLAPLNTSGTLGVHNGDQRYVDEERGLHESPRQFSQPPMHDSLHHRSGTLEPIGEVSVVGSPEQSMASSADPSRGPSLRDPGAQSWDRQHRQEHLSQSPPRTVEEEPTMHSSSEPLRSIPVGAAVIGAGAAVTGSMASHPNGEASGDADQAQSRSSHVNSGENMYTAFASSELARERTPPSTKPTFSDRPAGPESVLNPLNTTTGGPKHGSQPSPNFSRPTPQMLFASNSNSESQQRGQDREDRLESQQTSHYEQPTRSVRPLPSPGAPPTPDPQSERATSDVGLAYLDSGNSPVVQQADQFSRPSSRSFVPERQTQRDDQSASGSRSAAASPRIPEKRPEPMNSVHALTAGHPETSPTLATPKDPEGQQSVDNPAQDPVHDPTQPTRPLFSPKLAQGAQFWPDATASASSNTTPVAAPGNSTSPIIPPKSPGRRPSPLINTADLPPPVALPSQHAASRDIQPVQEVSQELSSTSHQIPNAQNNPYMSPSSAVSSTMSHQQPQQRAYNAAEDQNIHSDLLAALHFVDRTNSPPSEAHFTPVTPSTASESPSPVVPQYHVGPPKRGLFGQSSAQDEDFGLRAGQSSTAVEVLADEPPRSAATSKTEPSSAVEAQSQSTTRPVPASFPSSFAPNKRAEERLAAAKLAEQAQQAALTRPGKSAVPAKGKQKAWVDSDEDEDEQEDEDDDSEEEAVATQQRNRMPMSSSSSQQDLTTRNTLSVGPQPIRGLSPQRQSYYENGPSPDNRASSAWPSHSPAGSGQLPSSPSRGELHLHGESPGTHATSAGGLKPVVSPHGLLHAGIIDREERSARALEAQARDTGGPLVSIPSKPPPPQTGLVGAITSHQREKERTGGVGRALTEQQRERKLAEQVSDTS